MLITIFGAAAAFGFMTDVTKPTMDVIRHFSPSYRPSTGPGNGPSVREIRKPDSVPTIPRKVETPKRHVIVAVIDTGSDMSHPALHGHEWRNDGESGIDANGHDKATNGIDDDGNGYVDDVSGFDFAEKKAVVVDRHGHGTHIAGIVVRSAPNVKIMNLKYFNRGLDGASALSNSLEAMRYAIKMHADIINYSGGGTVASPEELAILKEADKRGILIVAAAGNESTNSERQPFYPANYRLPNILSVTAIDEARGQVEILPTSNFGVRSVAIAAQGKDVQSTLPGGHYGQMTGTSQATAFATGLAVRMLEMEPANLISPEEIIERIVTSASASDILKGKTRLGSKLSADRAMRFKSDRRPSASDRREMVQAFESELAGQISASLTP